MSLSLSLSLRIGGASFQGTLAPSAIDHQIDTRSSQRRVVHVQLLSCYKQKLIEAAEQTLTQSICRDCGATHRMLLQIRAVITFFNAGKLRGLFFFFFFFGLFAGQFPSPVEIKPRCIQYRG
jgi:hypothetical protein